MGDRGLCRRIDASDSRCGSRPALYLGYGASCGPARAAHRGPHGTDLVQAAVALPAAMVYAFVCLSAWYVARSLPIKTTGTARILFTGLVSSTLSSAVWLAVAGAGCRSGGARLAAGVGARRRLPEPVLRLWRVALSARACRWLPAGALRGEPGHRPANARGAGAGPGRAALAPFTARSAFPVQLPALD